MRCRAARTLLLLACLAWAGAAAPVGAEPAHAGQQLDKQANKHAHPRTQAHRLAHEPAQKPVHTALHKPAHQSEDKSENKPEPKPAHKLARGASRRQGRARVHAPVHKPPSGLAHQVAQRTPRTAAAAATPLPSRTEVRAPRPPVDPGGAGFLDLYVELCVKRIDEIDAFRNKLLRKKIPRLQPDSAKWYLSGVPGDAWPVPYHGKVGNFVLVLAENRNLCTLYARRTDTAALEQGFAEMVAKPPPPMLARRRPRTRESDDGTTRTVSMSWVPPGGQRKMQFVLTTTSAPGARAQAFASVEIVSGLAGDAGPDAPGAGNLTKPSSGSAAPAHRLRAQP